MPTRIVVIWTIVIALLVIVHGSIEYILVLLALIPFIGKRCLIKAESMKSKWEREKRRRLSDLEQIVPVH